MQYSAAVYLNENSKNRIVEGNNILGKDQIQGNMDIIKDALPTSHKAHTDLTKIQTIEMFTMSDIKTEISSPESDITDIEGIPENSQNIYKKKQCSTCKIDFDKKEYSEHSKCWSENISKRNTNNQQLMDSNPANLLASNAGLHSTLDIEIKDEPENGDSCSGDDECSLSKAPNIIPCEICDTTFGSNLELALHSIVHSKDGTYHCFVCDYRNNSTYDFEIHMRSHENTTHRCEVCTEEFTDKTEADEHKYLHTGETPFECETCGKRFMFSWMLAAHRRSNHWEVQIGMPIPKFDPNITHYKHHIHSTRDIRRHKCRKSVSTQSDRDLTVLCEICGKRLSSMKRLKFHLRVHTGYKPFVCTYCTKPFSRSEQLREHERVHTGERPYICRFCGKGFTQRSPLRIHERMHTGERPYQCRLCAKGYVSKGAADIHMKTCKGT